ncbi:MAG: squalene/phytoene synthase family protein [Acidobacteriota bacterium]|nr:squalene/phytoene synthase family protein [Acidobacteriota bacterium]
MASGARTRTEGDGPATPAVAAHETARPGIPASSVSLRRGPRGIVERIARSSGTNFYYAFLTLPRPRRDAIVAVYAFCHAVDGAVDDAPDKDAAHRGIAHWRRQLDLAFEGGASDPIAVRLAEAARAFSLPRRPLLAVIDGVEKDIDPCRYHTWDELASYCDLVAGAVGRTCVRIFGRDDEEADRYATELGRALQLTNILRDLGPDAALGRFYLPLDDVDRFGTSEVEVVSGRGRARLELLRHEVRRARSLFDAAESIGVRDGRTLCAAEVMRAIYSRLLTRVERAGFPVRPPVTRVPRHEKAAIAVAAWLRTRLQSGKRHE